MVATDPKQFPWRAFHSLVNPKLWGIEIDDPKAVEDGEEILIYPNMHENDARLLVDLHNKALGVPCREQTLRQAAQIAYRVCAETRHVTLGDKAAAAILALMAQESTQALEEIATPPVRGEPWIECWYGSEPGKGASVWSQTEHGTHKNMLFHVGADKAHLDLARTIVAAHNSSLRALCQPEADALPQDVINLVIAAREAFDAGTLPGDEEFNLDQALEPFSDRVPYEDEPEALE